MLSLPIAIGKLSGLLGLDAGDDHLQGMYFVPIAIGSIDKVNEIEDVEDHPDSYREKMQGMAEEIYEQLVGEK